MSKYILTSALMRLSVSFRFTLAVIFEPCCRRSIIFAMPFNDSKCYRVTDYSSPYRINNLDPRVLVFAITQGLARSIEPHCIPFVSLLVASSIILRQCSLRHPIVPATIASALPANKNPSPIILKTQKKKKNSTHI